MVCVCVLSFPSPSSDIIAAAEATFSEQRTARQEMGALSRAAGRRRLVVVADHRGDVGEPRVAAVVLVEVDRVARRVVRAKPVLSQQSRARPRAAPTHTSRAHTFGHTHPFSHTRTHARPQRRSRRTEQRTERRRRPRKWKAAQPGAGPPRHCWSLPAQTKRGVEAEVGRRGGDAARGVRARPHAHRRPGRNHRPRTPAGVVGPRTGSRLGTWATAHTSKNFRHAKRS